MNVTDTCCQEIDSQINPFNEWKYTVDMLNEGKLEVLDLITHRSDLDHLKQLFDDIHDHKVTICKAIYTDRE